MKYIIAFDIVDDRIRQRAVKTLLEYSYRVQKSVFEGFISKESLKELVDKMKDIINEEEDSVRFYPLCNACEKKVIVMGVGTTVEKVDYIIL